MWREILLSSVYYLYFIGIASVSVAARGNYTYESLTINLENFRDECRNTQKI